MKDTGYKEISTEDTVMQSLKKIAATHKNKTSGCSAKRTHQRTMQKRPELIPCFSGNQSGFNIICKKRTADSENKNQSQRNTFIPISAFYPLITSGNQAVRQEEQQLKELPVVNFPAGIDFSCNISCINNRNNKNNKTGKAECHKCQQNIG